MPGTENDRLWRFFAEFCRWDMAAGGPDPHMKVAGRICEGTSLEDRMWMAGCYMGTYVVPSAEIIWREWKPAEVLRHPDAFGEWIMGNWPGIVLRRERRAVRTPSKLARYFYSYADWLLSTLEDGTSGWLATDVDDPYIAYEVAWKDIQRVWGLGRYIALKGLEFMSRYCDSPSIQIPDIRASGGWSPRKALATLWPEHALSLNGGNGPEDVALAEDLALQTQRIMHKEWKLDLSMYEVQTLLCDWKQCYFGHRQYPGRSQDSELAHCEKVFSFFGTGTGSQSAIWKAREELFDPLVLGEKQGWGGVREELGGCQALYGFTWSDFLYDYSLTEGDMFFPVLRR